MRRSDHPPALPVAYVSRPRLLARLWERPVTLVCAPAGYGKSLLLAEACRSAGAAWHRLDEADTDPGRLLEGVAAALGAPAAAASDLARFGSWVGAGGTARLLAIDRAERIATSPAACRLLNELLLLAGDTFRIALAGRVRPPLPSHSRLRLEQRLTELTAIDLRFTEGESQAWLVAMDGGDPGAIALAEGWPAALQLLGSGPEPDWEGVLLYVESEVAASLDPESRRLLTDLSILEEWSGSACDRLLDRSDGDQLLREWGRSLPVGGRGEVHPLVRRLFRAQLEREPERCRSLHRRAARYAADRGQAETALRHALAAEDLGLAVPLLRRIGSALLGSGRLAELEQWLERSPAAVLDGVPELLRSLGEVLRRGGRPRRAVHWLRAAAAGSAGERDGAGLLGAFCRLALAHADLGEWSEVEAALRQVEEEMEATAGLARSEALRALAEYEIHRGQAEAAARRLREAAGLSRAAGDPESAGMALISLGAGALVALEQVEEALSTLREAQGLLGGATACEALLAEVQLLLDQERWHEAEEALGGAAPATPAQEALRWWALARTALWRGDREAARRYHADGLAALERTEPTALLDGFAALTEGWLCLAAGDTAAALARGRQASRLGSRSTALLHRGASRLIAACEGERSRPAAPLSAPAPTLRVECLGPFRVLFQGAVVPLSHWGRAQVKALFQYLLLQPGFAVSREAMLETFWPEAPPEQSRARLRVGLNRLRTALRPLGVTLETGSELIRLPREAIGGIDLLEFRWHLHTARQKLPEEPGEAVAACRAGRALYRGSLLADAFWSGVEPYRQQVERELQELLDLWQAAALRSGRPEEAIGALEELLALDPGAEEAARRLMSLLIDAGRRAEALRRYRELARWMKAEVGLEPSAQTQALLRQALE